MPAVGQLLGHGVKEAGTGTRAQDRWVLSGYVQTWLPYPLFPLPPSPLPSSPLPSSPLPPSPPAPCLVSTLVSTLSTVFRIMTMESNWGWKQRGEQRAMQSGTKDSGLRPPLTGGFSPALAWPLTGVSELPALPDRLCHSLTLELTKNWRQGPLGSRNH